MSIEDTLAERGKRYGSFLQQSMTRCKLVDVLDERVIERSLNLSADQIEAMHMICTKLARIVNGDPDYVDNWTDIAGYATLVAARLETKEGNE
jgi:Domain of unknown function (DUF6378)